MLNKIILFQFYLLNFCYLKPTKQCVTFEQHQQSQHLFKENLDILTAKAERLYYNGDFDGAYLICRKYDGCIIRFIDFLNLIF
jgi:hypothetical protein